ncbi:MAG TPA: DUF2970 domain-containing protein [Ottowia sp.]|uniref:DUF2970 domain-containing protein n=1 Tax=Ottowia sp. TaxID=1898956 RepID=UPI002C761F25|nr:DUF2970 domain-containing protein [Ottowia sp.]HMN22302.1 DUF2970 domain-containing protein [Ottowia sp.]
MSGPKPGPGAVSAEARPPASWLGLARTIAWGLFGVRKASAHQSDLGRVNPLHVVAAALVGLIVLVALLVAAAHWMAGSP